MMFVRFPVTNTPYVLLAPPINANPARSSVTSLVAMVMPVVPVRFVVT